MHVFQIKGIQGLLLLALGVIAALAVLLLVPSIFMMVLWNAVVFEGFKGPSIDLEQGFYLWGAIMLLLKVIFQPEIKLQMHNTSPEHRELRRKLMEQSEKQEAQKESSLKDNQAES